MWTPVRRSVAMLMGAVLAIGASLVLDVAAPTVAGAIGPEDAFRTAFAGNASRIDLSESIGCTTTPSSATTAFLRTNNTSVIIDGHGYTIDASGCPGRQVLRYQGTAGTLTLRNITITGGSYASTCDVKGGGVESGSNLVLEDATIIGNSATSSGSFPCTANGGGVYAFDTVTLEASTVANNTVTCASCGGGGTRGGGIAVSRLNSFRSTISNNTSSLIGGGVSVTNLLLVDSTVVDNTAVSAANISHNFMTAFGSVIAYPHTGTNCSGGGTTSRGFNVEQATSPGSCGLLFGGFGAPDFVAPTDPQLGALANNGGATFTRLPAPTSLLIDSVDADACNRVEAQNVATDQRDLVRPSLAQAKCDIGAVEVQAPNANGTYTPLPPSRILDTRTGQGLSGAFTPGQTRQLPVADPSLPTTGVEAVALNVTATAPSANGWLTLYPYGTTVPTASNLNFSAGQTVPNMVVVKIGQSGQISISNTTGGAGAGSVHVIADLVGYYGDGTQVAAAGQFTPIAPTRVLDTRSNFGLTGAFAPNQHRPLLVTGGATNVPDTASAVVMNVTATAPTAGGWLTVSPTGDTFPNASSLNFVAGQTVPNLVVAKIGAGDQVDITNTDVPSPPPPASGTVHVIADIIGYFDTTVSTLIPMPPQRILDTRTGTGTGGVIAPVGPNATIIVDPHTVFGLPPAGSYKGVIVNVTATGPTQGGWLTVYPSDATLPNSSNLNFVAGQTVPNLVQIGVGLDGTFKIENTDVPTGPHPSSGTVHIIADIVGFYR